MRFSDSTQHLHTEISSCLCLATVLLSSKVTFLLGKWLSLSFILFSVKTVMMLMFYRLNFMTCLGVFLSIYIHSEVFPVMLLLPLACSCCYKFLSPFLASLIIFLSLICCSQLSWSETRQHGVSVNTYKCTVCLTVFDLILSNFNH